MYQRLLRINTSGRGLLEITGEVSMAVREAGVNQGLCVVFLQHTSASLIISENADPSVCRDLERFFARLVPDGDALFEHDSEGADDMPAHLRSVLTRSDITVPIRQGRLALGTWQGIWLWEHRYAPHTRQVLVTCSGVGNP